MDADHPDATDPYGLKFDEGVVVMHPGGPRGFRAAAWELELDEPLFAAIALQLDDDPQLELVGLTGAGMQGYSLWPSAVFPVRVDFAADGTRESTTQYGAFGRATSLCGLRCLGQLHPIGDVDGDGYDDVLLALVDPDLEPIETAFFHILTGANDFDLSQPLARLEMDLTGDPESDPIQVHTADMNGDGLLDVAAVWTNEWQNDVERSATLQVWFAPFVDPPGPTATTGDTGQATDTAPPVDTADTAPPTTPPSAKPKRGNPKGGCGCTVAASPAAAWLLPLMLALSLHRRRRPS